MSPAVLGSLLAVICGLTWSASVIFFRLAGDSVHPVIVNLFKNTLGFILMAATFYFVDGQVFVHTSTDDFLLLFLSGAIGIGISDALYLASLNKIGATRIAILDCLYSPTVIVLSLIFFNEQFGPMRALGTALVLSAIVCVTKDDEVKGKAEDISTNQPASRRDIKIGMIQGALALIFMGVGIVLMKPTLTRIPLFYVIEIRLLAGVATSLILCVYYRNLTSMLKKMLTSKQRHWYFLGSLTATYVSLIFWVAGFKYADASIAAVLNQTATIFIVIFAVWFLKEKFTKLKLVATVLAIIGAVLVSVS